MFLFICQKPTWNITLKVQYNLFDHDISAQVLSKCRPTNRPLWQVTKISFLNVSNTGKRVSSLRSSERRQIVQTEIFVVVRVIVVAARLIVVPFRLLLGVGHLGGVLLPPFCASVLKPNLETNILGHKHEKIIFCHFCSIAWKVNFFLFIYST